jgi:hypothetical protein
MKINGYEIKPGANLVGANLRGADLKNVNLCGANLWGADLVNAYLRDVKLVGAVLRDADLRDANLWGADLRSADLVGANLVDADLRSANLEGADLRYANVTGTILEKKEDDNSLSQKVKELEEELKKYKELQMLTGDALLAKVKELRMQPEMTIPTPVSQDELMTIQFIQTTELLQLLTKATKLDMYYKVCEDEDGDYVISFNEVYTYNYDTEKVVITQSGVSTWDKSSYNFETMMRVFDSKLEEQEQERIKKEKRKELIARLTDEEKELLGVND